MLKERREIPAGQVTIFVDGCREHFAAMLPRPGGIVRAATKERNPIRCPGDNHKRAGRKVFLFYFKSGAVLSRCESNGWRTGQKMFNLGSFQRTVNWFCIPL